MVMVIPKTITAKTTTTAYHMDTLFVTSTCMHVVHRGDFGFGIQLFEYAYLMCMWHCALSYELQVVQKPWSLVYSRAQNCG